MRYFRILLALILVGFAPSVGQAQRLSAIRTNQNMEKGLRLGENYVDFYLLGFNHRNEALFVVDLVGKSWVYWVDPVTGRIVRKQYQTHFDPASAQLSFDGKTLLAGPSGWEPTIHHPDLLIIHSDDVSKYEKLRIGNVHTNVYTPYLLTANTVVISLLESTWDTELKDYAGDYKKGSRYEIWDWKKRRKLGIIKDEDAGADQLFFGSYQSQRWIVDFSKYQKDFDYPAAFRPEGVLNFLDIKTGEAKPRWQVIGNASQTIGYPVAQLSPTQIVSQSTIFEYPAKRIRPLQMQGERVRLLGVVPGQPQKMIVATKRGAELWDYARQKRLHRWADIKDVNQIYFSPDLRFFATQAYAKHLYQFYRFDPSWIQ